MLKIWDAIVLIMHMGISRAYRRGATPANRRWCYRTLGLGHPYVEHSSYFVVSGRYRCLPSPTKCISSCLRGGPEMILLMFYCVFVQHKYAWYKLTVYVSCWFIIAIIVYFLSYIYHYRTWWYIFPTYFKNLVYILRHFTALLLLSDDANSSLMRSVGTVCLIFQAFWKFISHVNW